MEGTLLCSAVHEGWLLLGPDLLERPHGGLSGGRVETGALCVERLIRLGVAPAVVVGRRARSEGGVEPRFGVERQVGPDLSVIGPVSGVLAEADRRDLLDVHRDV